MLQDIQKSRQIRVRTEVGKRALAVPNKNVDASIAKNIVDILFVFINGNAKNDNELNSLTRSLVLSALPGVRNGTIKYIDKKCTFGGSGTIKKLLDDIAMELRKRNG